MGLTGGGHHKSGAQDSLLGKTPQWPTDAQSCTQGATEVEKKMGRGLLHWT